MENSPRPISQSSKTTLVLLLGVGAIGILMGLFLLWIEILLAIPMFLISIYILASIRYSELLYDKEKNRFIINEQNFKTLFKKRSRQLDAKSLQKIELRSIWIRLQPAILVLFTFENNFIYTSKFDTVANISNAQNLAKELGIPIIDNSQTSSR